MHGMRECVSECTLIVPYIYADSSTSRHTLMAAQWVPPTVATRVETQQCMLLLLHLGLMAGTG